MTSPGWLRDPRYDAGLQRLELLQVEEARLHAVRARELAGLASRTTRDGWQGEAPFDSLLLDVAGTCRLGQVAAGSRLLDAEHLVARLPQTLAALESGGLLVQQAQVLVAETKDRSPEVCGAVEARVLPLAGPLPPADLRRLVRRAVLELDAAEQAEREEQARAERKVGRKALPDGMELLWAVLPAEQAEAAWAQLSQQARQARASGDERTTDQLRADLLAEQLAGAVSAGSDRSAGSAGAGGSAGAACSSGSGSGSAAGGTWVRPLVHVPVAVAAGLSDEACDLEGYGPISAAHARRLLVGAQLSRACVDPQSGEVWALDAAPRRGTGGAAREHVQQLPGCGAAGVHKHERGATSRGGALLAELPPDRPAPSPPAATPDGPKPPTVVPSAGDTGGPAEAVRRALLKLLSLPPPSPLPAEPNHDPSRPLARLVRARDVRCDGIGCSVPASRCELDHDVPWPDGDTSGANIVSRSQRCHHAKHAGWTPVRTRDATWWTSPGGRTYVVPVRGRRPPPLDLAQLVRRLDRAKGG